MKIHGLQKMTLLDYPGHVACTVFLGGCDFRCPFCHNFELIDGRQRPVMEDEEFFSFLEKRKGLLDGVAITGGEPLLHADIPLFITRIRDMGYKVKLDTNGYHPDLLKKIIDDNLVNYIAMDIKNSPSKYARASGLESIDMEKIDTCIHLIMNSGIPYEFRTTVTGELHSCDDFEEIGKLIRGADAYYLQQFVDRDTVPDRSLSAPTSESMREFLEIASKYVKSAYLRGL